MTRKTIIAWQADGFPVKVRGGPGVPSEYDSAACIRWLVDREIAKVQTETPANRLARVKADSIEMDNLERRGLLIRADAIEPKLKAAFLAAREMWQNEPARLAHEVHGKKPQDAEAILAGAFDAFLVKLSQWGGGAAGPDED